MDPKHNPFVKRQFNWYPDNEQYKNHGVRSRNPEFPDWRGISQISFVCDEDASWIHPKPLEAGRVYLLSLRDDQGFILIQLAERLEMPEYARDTNSASYHQTILPFFGLILLVDGRVFSSREKACQVLSSEGFEPWFVQITNAVHLDYGLWEPIGTRVVCDVRDVTRHIRTRLQSCDWLIRYHTGHVRQAIEAKIGAIEWTEELQKMVKDGKELLRLSRI